MSEDLFDFYDTDGDGRIRRDEFIEVLSLCAGEIGIEIEGHLEQIADAVFGNAALTEDGSITPESLDEVLRNRPNLANELSLAKNQFSTNKSLKQSSRERSQDASTNKNDGAFNCQELLDKWDAIIDVVSQYVPLCNKLRWEYITNNLVRFNFFLFIMFVSMVLTITRIISYWDSCVFLIIARCSGQCLNFFCSIIVLLVCRRSISILRSRGYGRYLPLDDHVYFHKMCGLFIAFHSFTHTFGHIFNFLIKSLEVPEPNGEAALKPTHTLGEYLFTTASGIGWIGHCASITGWFLLIIIVIMAAAQPFSRSLGKFELFYYTHLMYIPFWALLFIHAPNFWCWFLVPFLIFMVEFLIRLRNLLTNLTTSGRTTIIKAVPLPSNVIHLVIKRPTNFEYNPGDWIYVLIPQIAKYEWHPFTISSAPEQEGVIWLHIRAVGEWTKSLRSYFEGTKHRNHLSGFIKSGQFSISMDQFNQGDLSVNDSTQILGSQKGKDKFQQLRNGNLALAPIPENNMIETLETTSSNGNGDCSTNISLNTTNASSKQMLMPNITIFIDGPYGSPSSQIFRAEHAVLIATGIGVTPFASILQSIVSHYQKRRQRCPSCDHEFNDNRPPFVCKLKKVDFVWINRDQKSFEWFIKLLAELELTQSHLPPSERFLDIHIHLTAMEPAQTKSIGLQLALYLAHEKNKKDLVTGLRTRTMAGRPNWDDFFNQILEQKKGKVSVFFCGRPQLGRLLHRQCDRFGFKFRKEIF